MSKKMREINPFGLRLPAPLKESLEKFAEANHRSLNAEIVTRLTESVERPRPRANVAHDSGINTYGALSHSESAMLAVFRQMPAEKQLALLSLFK